MLDQDKLYMLDCFMFMPILYTIIHGRLRWRAAVNILLLLSLTAFIALPSPAECIKLFQHNAVGKTNLHLAPVPGFGHLRSLSSVGRIDQILRGQYYHFLGESKPQILATSSGCSVL